MREGPSSSLKAQVGSRLSEPVPGPKSSEPAQSGEVNVEKCPPANTIAKDALGHTWMFSDNEVALKPEIVAIMTRGKQKGTASSDHTHEGQCLIAHLLPTMTTASDTATMEIPFELFF